MLRECFVFSSMRLGVPFIAPRQLGAVESNPGRQFLPSIAWRTGQSGADLFPYLVKPTVAVLEPLAHRTLSGAHRTVRCPIRPLALATRRARIPRPTVGLADCWLTGQSGAPPDSLVNFSRTPPTKSQEQPVRQSQPGAPDTVRCTTGQSGAPRLSRLLAASSQAFPVEFPLILTLRQTCQHTKTNVLSLESYLYIDLHLIHNLA
jgi:hypothetical protein